LQVKDRQGNLELLENQL